ncbi:MAG TPA: DUF1398 family protein [Chitinophagaceae bacterium]|nr:DUF1398 family protein [Chitinophagaceae bacterium]
MFTPDQIKAAYSKVKTGADYPNYAKEIFSLGVRNYTTCVADGNTVYCGNNGFRIESGPQYASLQVATKHDGATFREKLKQHQSGLSDFPTFCKEAAGTGVDNWVVDLEKMTCTYYSKDGTLLVVEQIK